MVPSSFSITVFVVLNCTITSNLILLNSTRFHKNRSKMFILPLNTSIALVCTGISFTFEVLRIFLAWLLARPSDEVRQLTIQKVDKLRINVLSGSFCTILLFLLGVLFSFSVYDAGGSKSGIRYN